MKMDKQFVSQALGLHTCDTPNYTDGPCQACAEEKSSFMTTKRDGFLPCPFCGSTNLTLDNLRDGDDWFVSCDNCEIQQIANYPREIAIQRWNMRA